METMTKVEFIKRVEEIKASKDEVVEYINIAFPHNTGVRLIDAIDHRISHEASQRIRRFCIHLPSPSTKDEKLRELLHLWANDCMTTFSILYSDGSDTESGQGF